MLQLHTSGASPFARKVKVLAIETGLLDRIGLQEHKLTPVEPNLAVVAANPLGKIPCLVLDDGTAIYDSRVICEHLDGLHDSPRMLPPGGGERLQVLTLQALCDGILDAAVNVRYETVLRPDALRWDSWISGQKLKVARSLDRLEELAGSAIGAWTGDRLDLGTITAGCVCGYLDFRFSDDRWRDGRPALAAWWERIAERPGFAHTVPA